MKRLSLAEHVRNLHERAADDQRALGTPLLKERVTRGQWVAITVGLCGVLLIAAARRARATGRRPGASRPWAPAVCYALSAITLRKLARTETTESLVFSFTVLMAVGSGLLALPAWQPLRASEDLPWVVGIGVSRRDRAVPDHGSIPACTGIRRRAIRIHRAAVGVALDLAVWHVLPSAIHACGRRDRDRVAGHHLIRRETVLSRALVAT